MITYKAVYPKNQRKDSNYLIFAANLRKAMTSGITKLLPIAALSLCMIFALPHSSSAEEHEGHKEAAFQPSQSGDELMAHIMDGYEFHYFSLHIPLPVILYSPQKGFTSFMSSRLSHGATYEGYKLIEKDKVTKVVAVDAAGNPDSAVKVYDLSLTRNVVQMMIALIVLCWLSIAAANKYKRNGPNKAPSGFQNALETVIVFIRDEVGVSNLGKKYHKYMPYLLTVFFFILINNLFGLIPGSANVTGNIAVTAVLGCISFIVILFSGNKHYWGHIFNPPVPFGVKIILVLVEFLSIFTKPFALIIRLFANMIAGHMIITCLVMLIFIFSSLNVVAGVAFTPISLLFTIFIYFIEILVAFIQAYIFANLTAVFIGQAVEEAHHDNEHNGYDDAVII